MRNRTVREQVAAKLSDRIRAETVMVPMDIIPYTNLEGVAKGGLPIEVPAQGLTPEYCVYAVAPTGYRAHFYTEYGLDQFKSDRPDLVRIS